MDACYLAARFWARHIHRRLPCPNEIQWHMPQRLEKWLDTQPVHGQQYAVVLGPDAQRQQWNGLPVPRAPWNHKSQPDICQASAHTTPLIAYAQYDNPVFINYNRTVTFDYHTLCMADSFRRPWSQSRQGSGKFIHQGWMLAPTCPISSRLPHQHGLQWVGEHWVAAFLEDSRYAKYFDSYGTASFEPYTNACGRWAIGTYVTAQKCYRTHSRSPAFYFLHSQGMSLEVVTSEFRECEFACSGAMNKRFLG